jgi:hypothetical protein
MDAKTFLSKKHEAAAEELRAIEAEYFPKREAALAAIAMTQKWLDELPGEKPSTPPVVAAAESSLQDAIKNGANGWVSNRDLTPQAR